MRRGAAAPDETSPPRLIWGVTCRCRPAVATHSEAPKRVLQTFTVVSHARSSRTRQMDHEWAARLEIQTAVSQTHQPPWIESPDDVSAFKTKQHCVTCNIYDAGDEAG